MGVAYVSLDDLIERFLDSLWEMKTEPRRQIMHHRTRPDGAARQRERGFFYVSRQLLDEQDAFVRT